MEILNKLALVFPKDLIAETYKLYFETLRGCSLLGIRWACAEVLKYEKFFPTPAVILGYYENLSESERIGPERQLPEPEWTEEDQVRSDMAAIYYFQPMCADDPKLCQAAIDEAGQAGFERFLDENRHRLKELREERRGQIRVREATRGRYGSSGGTGFVKVGDAIKNMVKRVTDANGKADDHG